MSPTWTEAGEWVKRVTEGLQDGMEETRSDGGSKQACIEGRDGEQCQLRCSTMFLSHFLSKVVKANLRMIAVFTVVASGRQAFEVLLCVGSTEVVGRGCVLA